MTTATAERSIHDRALEVLRRHGNPFRNYFARNPDDDTCSRYHVPELFAGERDLLLGIIDLYRYDPMTHSEIVPVLGNKGAGKTHLLHSIKHGIDGGWQLLVTPGVYQRDSEFLEYILFQVIDTLLGGGKQKGMRPLEYIGEELVRQVLTQALTGLSPAEKLELYPATGLGRWTRKLGLGQAAATERVDWLIEALAGRESGWRPAQPVRKCVSDASIEFERAFDLITAYVERTEAHNTAGMMRRAIFAGFTRSVLLNDEADLANFLTYGFAELEFHVRPTRQDLVLALLKALMGVFRGLKIPVVVAFDQLEDLLLSRRSDDAHRIAEAFFAGIVQVMHQIEGMCFLIFAERGLWNRFVPSLDGYIQDRLNNPVHVPNHGTVKAVRLEAPAAALVQRVVEARLRPVLDELPDTDELSDIHPFNEEQVARIAKTEPTLRDMLQQFRHLFDHVVYGGDEEHASRLGQMRTVTETTTDSAENAGPTRARNESSGVNRLAGSDGTHIEMPDDSVAPAQRLESGLAVKSVVTVESAAPAKGNPLAPAATPEPPAAPIDPPQATFHCRKMSAPNCATFRLVPAWPICGSRNFERRVENLNPKAR